MCFPGGPVLSEAKRDRARHAQRAERSGGLQGGLGGQPPAGSRGGVQGRSPGGGLGGRIPLENFAKIEVF